MLNAFSLSGFGGLDTRSVDGGARLVQSMVSGQSSQCSFAWSRRESSRPEHAARCRSQLLVCVCKVPRWLQGGQRGGQSVICPLLYTSRFSLGSTVPIACCSGRTGEVRAVPLERSQGGVRSVRHVISHKGADCSHPLAMYQ